jgi:hypothetical protein
MALSVSRRSISYIQDGKFQLLGNNSNKSELYICIHDEGKLKAYKHGVTLAGNIRPTAGWSKVTLPLSLISTTP